MTYISSSSVVSGAFSALCVYSTFGHHPHPLDYLCAIFCFFRDLRCYGRIIMITSLSKVIWGEGSIAALTHPYAVKSPKFAPKSTPSCGPIPKPHYLPHPWTRPTYDAKWHPDPICSFSTVHWTDRLTDRPTL